MSKIQSKLVNALILVFGLSLIAYSVWFACISIRSEIGDNFSTLRDTKGLEWLGLIVELSLFFLIPFSLGIWTAVGAYLNLRARSKDLPEIELTSLLKLAKWNLIFTICLACSDFLLYQVGSQYVAIVHALLIASFISMWFLILTYGSVRS